MRIDNYICSLQMAGNRGQRAKKGKPQKHSGPLQTSISPAGTDVEDAPAAAFDGAALSASELREAGSHEGSDHEEDERWEAPFSAAHVQRLEAEIERLSTRLHTARFTARAATTMPDGNKKAHWRPDSIRIFPSDAPLMTKPGAILHLRYTAFAWLGSYSFVLRLAPTERQMMTPAELNLQRDNRANFLATWTQASLAQLHHDVFIGLQRHLGGSILVSHIFARVTTETEDCATRL